MTIVYTKQIRRIYDEISHSLRNPASQSSIATIIKQKAQQQSFNNLNKSLQEFTIRILSLLFISTMYRLHYANESLFLVLFLSYSLDILVTYIRSINNSCLYLSRIIAF